MGFRQLVWALIAILLIYGVWQFFRALVHGRKVVATAIPVGSADSRDKAQERADAGDGLGEDEIDEAGFSYAPLPAAEIAAESAPTGSATNEVRPDPFALELELLRLRREVGALRAALDVQQEEIGVLHETVKLLGDAGSVEAPKMVDPGQVVNASPEYGEALVLARRGFSVDDVSARCGITRAEAELVVSLAVRGAEEGGA